MSTPPTPFREPARQAVPVPRLDAAAQAGLERTRRIARLLDTVFRIPGTRFRFGLEQIIGLIPGAGDTVAAGLALMVLWNANRLGVSPVVQLRMALNILFDALVGMIPVAGDLVDFVFKASQRNLRLLERHLDAGDARARAGDWLIVLGTFAVLAAAVTLPLAVLVLVLVWLGRTAAAILAPGVGFPSNSRLGRRRS